MAAPESPQESLGYWTAGRAAWATLVAALVVGAIALLLRFHHIVILLFLAIVLAIALKPIVDALAARGMRWSFGVGAVFSCFGLILLAFMIFAVPTMVRQATDFYQSLPSQYKELRTRLADSDVKIIRRSARILPGNLPAFLESVSLTSEEDGSEASDESISPAINVIGRATQLMLAALLVCVLSAYWLVQEQRTLQAILLLFPTDHREDVRTLLANIEEKLGAYVRGQALLCLIVGSLSLLGYWIIGLPQAVLLALIAGLLEAVPMIGPILGAVPAVFVALATDPTKAVGVIAATIVIQQIENYLLVPRVMQRAIGMPALATLLAIAAFGALFGLLGAILAMPLAVILQAVLDRTILAREAMEPEQPLGRDRVSRVQYELQSLVTDVRMVVRKKPRAARDGNDNLEEAIESLAADLAGSLKADTDRTPAPHTSEPLEPCAAGN